MLSVTCSVTSKSKTQASLSILSTHSVFYYPLAFPPNNRIIKILKRILFFPIITIHMSCPSKPLQLQFSITGPSYNWINTSLCLCFCSPPFPCCILRNNGIKIRVHYECQMLFKKKYRQPKNFLTDTLFSFFSLLTVD